MSQDSVERLLGRMLTDAYFRVAAASSLQLACRQGGYDLSEDELRLVARINTRRFESISDLLDPGLCRATLPSRSSEH